jgi:pimeloyl-ACP methyl ester carboxylesterase
LNYRTLWDRNLLKLKYLGEYLLRRWNPNAEYRLQMQQELEYFNRKVDSSHRSNIDKQISMIKWQTNNTNGFWGSLLSSYRFFPLEGMENIYINVGRHYRPVLVIWGNEDKICSAPDCTKKMEDYFPNGNLIDVIDCGHNAVSEKFDEVSTEIYSFLNELIHDRPPAVQEEEIDIKIERFSLIKPGVFYEGRHNKKKIFNVNPGSSFQSPSKI